MPSRYVKLSHELVIKLKETLKTQVSGSFMGSVGDLAEKYGVSYPTMRETFRLLENQGLVTMRSGITGGVYAAEKERRILLMTDSIRTINDMESEDANQLFDFRIWIEGLCTEVATVRCSPHELEQMENSVQYLTILVDRLPDQDVSEILEENIRFHHLIAQATHNALLFRTFESIEAVVYEQTGEPVYAKETLQEVVQAHRKVMEAMKKEDSALACRRMQRHLEAFHQYVEQQSEH